MMHVSWTTLREQIFAKLRRPYRSEANMNEVGHGYEAHSTTSPTLTMMGQSFIMTLPACIFEYTFLFCQRKGCLKKETFNFSLNVMSKL
jgi:hypothetical protein